VINLHFTNEPKRIFYVIAVILTIALGLSSRYFTTLPPFIQSHAGDTIWAMMVYFLFRFFFIHRSKYAALYLSVIFCFIVEFSQLYQANWINTIRDTLLGALILGKGFLGKDLLRYCIGIVIAFILDKWIYPIIAQKHLVSPVKGVK